MGLQAWDANTGDQIPVEPQFGMEYPANSGVEHIFGLGPRIGGIKNGIPYVVRGYEGAFEGKEILPNRNHVLRELIWHTSIFDSVGTPNKRYQDDDNDGLVDEDDLDGNDNDGDWNPSTDDVGADGLADPFELSCDGASYDSITNPDPAQDNYDPLNRDKCHTETVGDHPLKNNRDKWTEKNGIPDHGEPHVDEDYGAVSQNDLYCSATDTFSTPITHGHIPLGIKVIQKSYAWDSDIFDAILPFEYYFINMGRETITDVYIGFFADMDVGPVNAPDYQSHNYAGYIHELKTAYVHNPVDRGSTPVGLTILGTPKSLDSLRYIFNWSGVPYSDSTAAGSSLAYDMMSGRGRICIPEDPNCLIEADQSIKNLTDTRFLLSFGPFEELKQFDTIKVSVALISGYGVYEGINSLVENSLTAIRFYNRNYMTPPILCSPKFEAKKGYRRVELKWYPHVCALDNRTAPFDVWDDSNKLAGSYPEDHWRRINPPCEGDYCIRPGGRIFNGFRLYRSESPDNEPAVNSFVMLAEYLLPENWDLEDLNSIDSTYVDSMLSWGKRYWYALTTVGLPPDISIIAIPQSDGSIRYDTLYSDNGESSMRENWLKVDMEFPSSESVGKVLAVPNPYRVDRTYTYESGGWEGYQSNWSEFERSMKFIRMPAGEWTIRIFTVAGEIVQVIQNRRDTGYRIGNRVLGEYRGDRGEADFDLMNEGYRPIASGVYIFTVESDFGEQTGKFVVIR
jgi:hypothetical protein